MKNILLYLLLLSSFFAGAQVIVVPDANFLGKLLQSNVSNGIAKNADGNSIAIDSNYDGQITVAEALLVRELNVSDAAISSVQGLDHFANVRTLYCSGNLLTELYLASLTDLRNLYCFDNAISSFVFGANTDLRIFHCYSNNLTALNVEEFENLKELKCGQNALTSLSTASLSYLEVLDFSGNNLTTINLSGLASLTELNSSQNTGLTTLNLAGLESLELLNCSSNGLAALDVTMLVNLTGINCSNNSLTTLDLSANNNLTDASFFANSLVTLFIKNGINESFVPANWTQNPLLEYICADESQVAALKAEAAMPAMVQINSYCSNEPGGAYNRITGTVRYDTNNNGCDAGDFAIPSFRLGINAGLYADTVFTKADGTYTFYVGTGTFTVSPQFENDYFISAAVDGITYGEIGGFTMIRDFCISSNGTPHNDVEVVIAPLTNAQPGLNAVYKMVYKNKGNQVIAAGDVTCYWDSSRLSYVDMTPMANGIGVDTYTWNYTNLKPFDCGEILMKLKVNNPSDTPAVNVNDVLSFSVEVNPGTDEEPYDNVFDFNQVVVNSEQPNAILCLEGNTVSPDAIGDYLHYIVNFKNTGSAPADFVVVEMDVDTDEFDISTLRLINNSQSVTAKTLGNKAVFRFSDTMMAVDGNGNLIYKIKSRNGLLAGATVSNKVTIYFDYNTPIETAPAVTTFGLLGLDDHKKDNSVVVYPNPSKDVVTIAAAAMIQSIQLYDMQGRLLQVSIINDHSALIDLTRRASGVYFVKINTEKGIKVEKLIRE